MDRRYRRAPLRPEYPDVSRHFPRHASSRPIFQDVFCEHVRDMCFVLHAKGLYQARRMWSTEMDFVDSISTALIALKPLITIHPIPQICQ